jgi:threonine/homoserine efflux transporter RhtA
MAGGFVVGFVDLVALFGPEALLEFGCEASDLLSQLAETTFLSLINYRIPVVALAAGAIVLDEDLVGTVLIGMALILTGLAISQLGSRSV